MIPKISVGSNLGHRTCTPERREIGDAEPRKPIAHPCPVQRTRSVKPGSNRLKFHHGSARGRSSWALWNLALIDEIFHLPGSLLPLLYTWTAGAQKKKKRRDGMASCPKPPSRTFLLFVLFLFRKQVQRQGDHKRNALNAEERRSRKYLASQNKVLKRGKPSANRIGSAFLDAAGQNPNKICSAWNLVVRGYEDGHRRARG